MSNCSTPSAPDSWTSSSWTGCPGTNSERGQPFAILDDPLPPDEDLAYAHIGVRKNNPELVDAINEAIVHIKLNGDYDRIVRKYFPFSIY